MIAIDASILVRYIAQDDPEQSALAARFLECDLTPEVPGLVTLTALLEMCWVLSRIYRQDWGAIRGIVAQFLAAPNLVIEQEKPVIHALAAEAGFADALIHYGGIGLGAISTMTFDRKFARLDGVELLS